MNLLVGSSIPTDTPLTFCISLSLFSECADEPLFSSVPVPKEMLRPFSIARHPTVQPIVEPAVELGIPNASFAIRLTRQASSQVFPTTRSASVSREMLSKRHSMTRENSQFFRSRLAPDTHCFWLAPLSYSDLCLRAVIIYIIMFE